MNQVRRLIVFLSLVAGVSVNAQIAHGPNTPVTPPSNDYQSDIAAGEYVIAIDSLKDVVVISTNHGQSYVVRDQRGNVYSNIGRSDLAVRRGCASGFSVGQQVIAIDSVKNVNLLAIDLNGNFVVVDLNGNRYANIGSSDLASLNACNGDVCTGQMIYAVDSARELQVLAAQTDGNFVLQDQSGHRYANISRSDIAVESGQIGGIYAGEWMIALDSNKYVQVVGLQQDGNFVVRDQNGNVYANIGSSDLAPYGQ